MFSSKAKPLPAARLSPVLPNAIAPKQSGVLLGLRLGSVERSAERMNRGGKPASNKLILR